MFIIIITVIYFFLIHLYRLRAGLHNFLQEFSYPFPLFFHSLARSSADNTLLVLLSFYSERSFNSAIFLHKNSVSHIFFITTTTTTTSAAAAAATTTPVKFWRRSFVRSQSCYWRCTTGSWHQVYSALVRIQHAWCWSARKEVTHSSRRRTDHFVCHIRPGSYCINSLGQDWQRLSQLQEISARSSSALGREDRRLTQYRKCVRLSEE